MSFKLGQFILTTMSSFIRNIAQAPPKQLILLYPDDANIKLASVSSHFSNNHCLLKKIICLLFLKGLFFFLFGSDD